MDQIKSAFLKVKEDISFFFSELAKLKSELFEIRILIKNLYENLNNLKPSTHPTHNPTHLTTPTHNPTHQQEVKGLKSQFLAISTGSKGVPTDRQTDRQTNQQTEKTIEKSISEASEILNSLDKIKKEIRLKFKKITSQEMVVFSAIYQLEEQEPENTSYGQIAKFLHLSESSIRDYTQRLISKGIPIKKQKINNKKILLSVSQDLKKIATLAAIIKLREI